MSYIMFDTLKFAKKLIEVGMSKEQAEIFVFAQKEALEEAVDGGLATKVDISELEKKITHVESTVKVLHWMTGFVLSGVFAIGVKIFFI
jgi:hypothetical protein